MPQSLSAVYLHLVFSTKNRTPFLLDHSNRTETHAYLAGISKNLDCPSILVGGVADHIHLLARQSRTISQSHWIKELKRASSIWIKERHTQVRDFAWQSGYGVFSVSQSNVEKVTAYIADQEEHHRIKSFQEEFRTMLKNIGSNGTNNTFGTEPTARAQPLRGSRFFGLFHPGVAPPPSAQPRALECSPVGTGKSANNRQ